MTGSHSPADAETGRRIAAALMLPALVSLAAANAEAAAPRPEYEVKAAYLLNFTRYVSWPEQSFPDPAAPIIIGVFGQDPFGAVLDRTVAGRTSHGRPLAIRRLARPEEARDCHLVFVDRDARGTQEVLRETGGLAILTVGETRRFVRNGGAIGLILIGETVQFEVNLEVTAAASLKVSSRMLGLAHDVIGASPGGGAG